MEEAKTDVSTQATNSQDNPLAGFGPNEWIVEDMYQRYLSDPASVDPAWHDFFADYRPGGDGTAPATSTAAPAAATGTTAAPAKPAAPAKTQATAQPTTQPTTQPATKPAAAPAAKPAPAKAQPAAKAEPAPPQVCFR